MAEKSKLQVRPQRILAIDYIKAFAIIFVVCSHINNYNSDLKIWLTCFSPNAFFVSHGMVYKQKVKCISDWKKFILDKLFTIIVPYFIWAMLYSAYSIENVAKIAYGSHEGLSLAESLTSLWFLPCLFLADIIFELFMSVMSKIKKSRILFGTISAFMIILMVLCIFIPHPQKGWPFEADAAIQAVFWLAFGFLMMTMIKSVIKKRDGKPINVLILVVFAIISFAVSLIAYLNTSMNGGYVMFAEARYGNYLLYIISAIGGCCFVASMSFLCARIKNALFVKIMQFIGQSTMIIFALHKPIIHLLQDILNHISIPNIPAMLIILIVAVGGSLILAPFINTYLPLLAGKVKYIKIKQGSKK